MALTHTDTPVSTLKINKFATKADYDAAIAQELITENELSFVEETTQANWTQSDTTAPDYIQNKPTIPTVDYPVTDVKIGSTSVVSNKVATINTQSTYNASSNKIATMSDLPSVGDREIEIQKNGTKVDSFTTNESGSTKKTINITVPTQPSDINAQPAGNYQPLDADLTAIAGLTGTSGLLKKTAADNWTLDTTSYGTYSKPSGGIPSSDLAESYYLASNPNGYTSNTGTVTSVGGQASSGSHISVSGGPITTSGTLTIGVESGYAIPSNTDITSWNNKVSNVQSDWNASSGLAQILNKPTIPTNSDFSLAGLSDTTVASPSNGQVLTYNGSAWVNSTPSAGTDEKLAVSSQTTGFQQYNYYDILATPDTDATKTSAKTREYIDGNAVKIGVGYDDMNNYFTELAVGSQSDYDGEVVVSGNSYNNFTTIDPDGIRITDKTTFYSTAITTSSISQQNSILLPDDSGTLALISDIPPAGVMRVFTVS